MNPRGLLYKLLAGTVMQLALIREQGEDSMELKEGMRVIVIKATGELRSYEMVTVIEVKGDDVIVGDTIMDLHTVKMDNIQILTPDPDHH
jgi:flagellar biogenesis protein FliO